MIASGIRFLVRLAVAGYAALALRLTLIGLLWLPAHAFPQTPAAQPFQVEAVFLFNFTQFVTWPADAFSRANDPFSICVLGEDPFGSYLDQTLAGETAQGRSLQPRRLKRVEEAGRCHILFISRSEAPRLGEILAHLNAHGTLTVSDAENFGRQGGMIRFVVENHRVRLRVNVDAARAAQLAISSKLLRIAELVTPERP